ncbi:MAG: isochorismatase family protein [Gammaproteobacteria bacterium]|nr:isochorismatase family protein [Gammaproteobacteria bacterium]MBV9620776.1 isochorismatase family protein [Gammaproteobacteria bacterium]
MKQALIVIDVQESFRSRPYFTAEEVPGFLRNVQSLINRCAARGIAVVQVFHCEGGDAANPFTLASGQVRAMAELALQPDLVVHKSVHSALLGRTAEGETLEAWLRARGIGELLISGIRTEQCCETTARHASDLGFKVRYVTDATLTFPMHTRGGRRVSPAEIRERTEMVLDERFATIVSTAGALA